MCVGTSNRDCHVCDAVVNRHRHHGIVQHTEGESISTNIGALRRSSSSRTDVAGLHSESVLVVVRWAQRTRGGISSERKRRVPGIADAGVDRRRSGSGGRGKGGGQWTCITGSCSSVDLVGFGSAEATPSVVQSRTKQTFVTAVTISIESTTRRTRRNVHCLAFVDPMGVASTRSSLESSSWTQDTCGIVLCCRPAILTHLAIWRVRCSCPSWADVSTRTKIATRAFESVARLAGVLADVAAGRSSG